MKKKKKQEWNKKTKIKRKKQNGEKYRTKIDLNRM